MSPEIFDFPRWHTTFKERNAGGGRVGSHHRQLSQPATPRRLSVVELGSGTVRLRIDPTFSPLTGNETAPCSFFSQRYGAFLLLTSSLRLALTNKRRLGASLHWSRFFMYM